METIALGRSGLKVTRISFGMWVQRRMGPGRQVREPGAVGFDHEEDGAPVLWLDCGHPGDGDQRAIKGRDLMVGRFAEVFGLTSTASNPSAILRRRDNVRNQRRRSKP